MVVSDSFKGCAAFVGIGLLLMVAFTALNVAGCLFRPVNEAINVAHEEFGPRAALAKYEWFKDAAAKLDQKRADITQYSRRSESLAKQYAGVPFKDWDRKDKEHLAIWDSEVVVVKASYNEIAADYNAQRSISEECKRRFTVAARPPRSTHRA
jgi:hypothetical protein